MFTILDVRFLGPCLSNPLHHQNSGIVCCIILRDDLITMAYLPGGLFHIKSVPNHVLLCTTSSLITGLLFCWVSLRSILLFQGSWLQLHLILPSFRINKIPWWCLHKLYSRTAPEDVKRIHLLGLSGFSPSPKVSTFQENPVHALPNAFAKRGLTS